MIEALTHPEISMKPKKERCQTRISRELRATLRVGVLKNIHEANTHGCFKWLPIQKWSKHGWHCGLSPGLSQDFLSDCAPWQMFNKTKCETAWEINPPTLPGHYTEEKSHSHWHGKECAT